MDREHTDLLLLSGIARELAALAIEDKRIGTVPVFYDVEPLVELSPEGLPTGRNHIKRRFSPRVTAP
jgi:hypothetical protein